MLDVLVVDDETIILRGLLDMIGQERRCVTRLRGASNAYEALESAARSRPDLVITDINMPVLNGLDMIQRMRDKKLCDKFVVLTGYDEFEYVRNALRQGVIDYVSKPVNPKYFGELLQRISNEVSEERLQFTQINRMKLWELMLNPVASDEIGLSAESLAELLPHAHTSVVLFQFRADRTPAFSGDPEDGLTAVPYDRVLEAVRGAFGERALGMHLFSAYRKGQFVLLGSTREPLTEEELARLYEACADIPGGESFRLRLGVSRTLRDNAAEHSLHRLYVDALKSLFLNELFLKIDFAFFHSRDPNLDESYFRKLELYLETMGEEEAIAAVEADLTAIVGSRTDDLPYLRKIYAYFALYINVYLEKNGLSFEEVMGAGLVPDTESRELADARRLRDGVGKMIETLYRYFRSSRTGGHYTEAVSAIVAYVEDRYRSVTLNDLAHHVRLHPSYVSALLKKEVGLTFLQYVHHIRIAKAKELLLSNPQMPVQRIAIAVGFENENHFFKTFKKLVGTTPGQLRRDAGNSD